MPDETEPTADDPRAAENLLVPLSSRGEELASPEEIAAFEARFMRLLERRTAMYTMGDSTSVPRNVAAELLLSISFVLGIDPGRPQVPKRLLSVDLEGEYRRRLDDIAARVAAAEELWRRACETMPLIENIALRDTLKSVGEFFKWYDYRSMAHDIPASVDYPLCHPVPETLRGIDYIAEYVRRLMIEADFLRRFDQKAVERVLAASSPDYIELLVNLYEPVATNAIGLALIGKDPHGLIIAEEDRAEIARRLEPLGDKARLRVLRQAAVSACEAVGVGDEAAEEYLSDLVPELLPRIAVGLTHGELSGVFVG